MQRMTEDREESEQLAIAPADHAYVQPLCQPALLQRGQGVGEKGGGV